MVAPVLIKVIMNTGMVLCWIWSVDSHICSIMSFGYICKACIMLAGKDILFLIIIWK